MSETKKENNEELQNEVEKQEELSEEIIDSEEELQNESKENKSEEKKENQIAEFEEKIKSLHDTLLRKVAEFENYKRRTENDQMNLMKYAAESFIIKILPIYDDLQRSVLHLGENSFDSVKEGLKLVLDKFTKTLDDQGIKKIEAKGQEFNVEFHEALLQQPSKDVPPNTVIEEVDPGYFYKDRVIKHAKVIVSKEAEE